MAETATLSMRVHGAETLRGTPGVQRFPSPKLDLYRVRCFLDAATCAAVMERIDVNRAPSTIIDSDYTADAYFRTSETCHFDEADPVIAEIDRRIAALLGLPEALGEPMQGQRYDVGQEFKAHTDYFDEHGVDYMRLRAGPGQRTWTAMVYLNEPAAGGATRFKAAGKTFQPETGALLAWNNLRADGSVNPSTIHHGMKVRAGTKYVITKWFCERPWPRG